MRFLAGCLASARRFGDAQVLLMALARPRPVVGSFAGGPQGLLRQAIGNFLGLI